MSWRENLRAASFRGVAFEVDGDDLTTGRRGVIHEYPQRDTPYVEDNGRATRRISLQGFVIGADYMLRRDALLAAIEQPGPGRLVHPLYGEMSVIPDGDCRVSHTRDEGGMCRFQLSFVEAGDLSWPTSQPGTRQQAVAAAAALDQAAADDFSGDWQVAVEPDSVLDGAVAALEQVRDAISAAFDPVNDALDAADDVRGIVFGDIPSLVMEPLGVASRIRGLLQSFRLGRGLRRIMGRASPAPASTTAIGARVAGNSAALDSLVRRTALAQGARAAAGTEWPVYDDALAARQALTAAFDAEVSVTSDDAVVDALTAARIAANADITARSLNAARVVTVTPQEAVPAVVLAYDRYGSHARADEIVVRNRVPRPVFLAGPILVLTR